MLLTNGVADGVAVVDVLGVTDGLPGVELGVEETDGIGVLLTNGVADGVAVVDVLGVIKGMSGVELGVKETVGTGVWEIDGVTDNVGVTLGDKGTTRTGHSKVYFQHGSSSNGFCTVT